MIHILFPRLSSLSYVETLIKKATFFYVKWYDVSNNSHTLFLKDKNTKQFTPPLQTNTF